MKNFATVSLLAALGGLILAPAPARAHDKTLAAIGGFIGGVIVGSSIEHSRPGPQYCGPDYDRGPRVAVSYGAPRHGYWRVVTIKTWVPARWVVFHDYGHKVRRYEPGYFRYRTERVWVDSFDRRDGRWNDRGDDHRRDGRRY